MDSYNSTFASVARHVPRTLRHQLICKLTSQFLESYGIEDDEQIPKEVNKMEPTMERFYAALLFVDISGFTGLAQKLDVESLKNHINDYFTKMLNVIDKWDGDVIKFAGDALYIVWRVEYNNKHESNNNSNNGLPSTSTSSPRDIFSDNAFINAAKLSVERAVSCALEINACCCNHKVLLQETATSGSAQSRWSKLFNSLPVILGQNGTSSNSTSSGNVLGNTAKVSPLTPAKSDDKVAYLNVHSGVGFGLLAGVDVGCRDRWEFFLLGEPISQVANAESLAQTGDVVISEIVHSLIHPYDPSHVTNHNSGHNSEDMYLGTGVTIVEEDEEQILPCGCCRIQYDFFKISKQMTTIAAKNMSNSNGGASSMNKAKFRRSKSKAKFDEFALNEALQSHEEKLYEFYAEEIEGAFACIQQRLKQLMWLYLEKKKINCRPLIAGNFRNSTVNLETSKMLLAPMANAITNTEDEIPLLTSSLTTTLQKTKLDRYIVDFLQHQVRDQFYIWISKCLIDDLVKHAHEAARGSKVEFFNLCRLHGFQRMMMKNFEAMVNVASGNNSLLLNQSMTLQSTIVSEEDELDEELDSSLTLKPHVGNESSSHSTSSNSRHRSKPRRSSLVGLRKTSSQVNMIQDASLSAEMRTVTVLFVKIDGLASNVTIDDGNDASHDNDNDASINNTNSNNLNISGDDLDEEWLLGGRSRANAQVCYDRFHFLQRSAKESKADTTLLKQLQACMEVLVTSFASKGGHLRQFIIDDKGTVCIGTFGLRGAMAGDNAAAALETAKRIIIDLQAIDLTAAIGITSGKAYCGIVGSPTRHEYAVMGPSVNLSARLMCQAMACTVICDNETKSRDRAHAFEPLQEVVAKGYVQPVMTYKPVFVDLLSPSSIGHIGQFPTKISEQALSALSPNIKWRSQNPHSHGFLRSSLDMVAMESYQQFSQVLLQNHRDSFDMENTSSKIHGGTSRKSMLFSPATTNSMLQLANANNGSLNSNNAGSPGVVASNNSPFANSLNLPNLNVIAEHAGSINNSFIAGELSSANAFNAIVSSEFYIQRKRGSREFVAIHPNGNPSGTANANTVQQLRLYGRDKEISEIIEFLFLSFTVSSGALLSAYHHHNTASAATATGNSTSNNPNSTSRHRPLFDLTQPCKLLAVTGNEGSGKSALVNAVAKKLVSVSRQDQAQFGNSKWNLTVLKNKASTLHANVPFYPWIFVIQDMLLKVHRLMTRPGNSNSNRLQHFTIEQQMQSGLKFLQKCLSPETQQLIPLLGSLNILPTEEESERTQYMQGRSRYLHSLELLFQLLQAFPVVTNRLAFVVLEKLCLFDPWSLSLLHRVWKHGKGFTFLVTYCPLKFQSAMKTIGAFNGSVDFGGNIGGSIMLNGPGSILFNPKSSISHSILYSNAFNASSNKVNMQLAAALANATNAAYVSRTPSVDTNNNVNGNNGENTNTSSRNASPNRTLYSTVNNHSASNKNNMSMKNVFVNNRTEADKRFFLKYWDDSRFHRLELKLLDKDAIASMVRDTLQVSIPMKSSVLDRVYDLSGGNPLYAFEIANSINASAPALASLVETDDNETNNNDVTGAVGHDGNNNDSSFASPNDKSRKRSIHDNDADGNGNTLNKGDKVAASLEQILAVTSNRIEEVICYRFDQQSHLTQVMLKAASVICSNGANFTLDMLMEVLTNSAGGYNNDVDRVEEQSLTQALAELVLREEFLQIVQIEEDEKDTDEPTNEEKDEFPPNNTLTSSIRMMSPSASKRSSRNAALRRSIVSNAAEFEQDEEESGSHSTAFTPVSPSKLSPTRSSTKATLTVLDNATIKRSKFSFRVVLEQITLYNLLVREKKERLHDAVANYYYRRQEGTVETLLEEAFHWQHAMVWAHALSCYYKAALKVWEVGDYEGYQQQLQAAFRIYHNLRSDVGITQTYEVHLDRLKELFTQYHNQQYQHQIPQQQQTPKTPSAHNMILLRNSTNNGIAGSHSHSSQNVLLDDNTPGNNSVSNNGVNVYQNNVLSTELIHEMCYSDNETLSTILQTHIRSAQFNILTLESPLYTTLMLEEALQLLILSHAENAQLYHGNNSGGPSPSGSGRNIMRFNSNIRSLPGSGNNSPNNHRSPQNSANNHHPLRSSAPYSPRSPKSALYAIQKSSPNQSMDYTNNTTSSPNMNSPSNNSVSSNHIATQNHANNNNLGVMSVFKKNPGLLSVQTQPLALQQTQPRFKLAEYIPIHLSLYAAFIHMHTWAPTSNSQRLMKAEFVQHYFAKLAKQQKPLKESVHYIQALSQTISLYIRYTQLKEAWIFGKKLMKLYKVEIHNAGLVSLYGVDMCNFLLAMLAQQLFLVGDIQHGTLLLEKAIDNWKELAMLSTTASIMSSSSSSEKPKPQINASLGSNQQQQLMYSLHLSFLPICGCLVLFHRYEEAIAMVDTMSFLDGSSHHVSSSLALLPQAYKTDVKSILVLQMKLVEGLLVNSNKAISPSASSNPSSNKNSSSSKFDPNTSLKNPPKRPSIRASMFLQSSAFASAIRSSDKVASTASSTKDGNTRSMDEENDPSNSQKNQLVKNRLRRSLVAAENHVLPPTLAEDEEYAPKKQSYLSHLMFISGMASEALKIDVELLKIFSSPTEKETVAQNPSAVMKQVAEKYEKLSTSKNADFDAMVLSELWPLITLLVLFRRSNYQNNNNAASNKVTVNSSKTNTDSPDAPVSQDTASEGTPPSPTFIAPKAPDVPRSLIKAVIALAKRCEQHQYFLASAILGFFLSEMQVPLKVQETGEKVKRRAFENVRQVHNSEKYEAFEESFRLIVKGDFTAFVVTPRHDVSGVVSEDEKDEK